jgi:hypothetical protein
VIDPNRLVEEARLASVGDPESRLRFFNLAMLSHLDDVAEVLPPELQQTLEFAHHFWNELDGTREQLLLRRIACWTYIDSVDTVPHGPSFFAARALVCTLFTDDESGVEDDELDEYIETTAGAFASAINHLRS